MGTSVRLLSKPMWISCQWPTSLKSTPSVNHLGRNRFSVSIYFHQCRNQDWIPLKAKISEIVLLSSAQPIKSSGPREDPGQRNWGRWLARSQHRKWVISTHRLSSLCLLHSKRAFRGWQRARLWTGRCGRQLIARRSREWALSRSPASLRGTVSRFRDFSRRSSRAGLAAKTQFEINFTTL